jgi:hypothetical protein
MQTCIIYPVRFAGRGFLWEGKTMADDNHYFRVKFENAEVEIMGWPDHELRGDGNATIFAGEQERNAAKLENREPRSIASVERIY